MLPVQYETTVVLYSQSCVLVLRVKVPSVLWHCWLAVGERNPAGKIILLQRLLKTSWCWEQPTLTPLSAWKDGQLNRGRVLCIYSILLTLVTCTRWSGCGTDGKQTFFVNIKPLVWVLQTCSTVTTCYQSMKRHLLTNKQAVKQETVLFYSLALDKALLPNYQSIRSSLAHTRLHSLLSLNTLDVVWTCSQTI